MDRCFGMVRAFMRTHSYNWMAVTVVFGFFTFGSSISFAELGPGELTCAQLAYHAAETDSVGCEAFNELIARARDSGAPLSKRLESVFSLVNVAKANQWRAICIKGQSRRWPRENPQGKDAMVATVFRLSLIPINDEIEPDTFDVLSSALESPILSRLLFKGIHEPWNGLSELGGEILLWLVDKISQSPLFYLDEVYKRAKAPVAVNPARVFFARVLNALERRMGALAMLQNYQKAELLAESELVKEELRRIFRNGPVPIRMEGTTSLNRIFAFNVFRFLTIDSPDFVHATFYFLQRPAFYPRSILGLRFAIETEEGEVVALFISGQKRLYILDPARLRSQSSPFFLRWIPNELRHEMR